MSNLFTFSNKYDCVKYKLEIQDFVSKIYWAIHRPSLLFGCVGLKFHEKWTSKRREEEEEKKLYFCSQHYIYW